MEKSKIQRELPSGWEELEISEVFEFKNTASFSRDTLSKVKTENEVMYIHYGDIHATYKTELVDFNIETRIPYLKDEYISANLNYLKEGDLVLADASEDLVGIGESIEIKNIGDKKAIAGLHTFLLRDSNNKTTKGFRTYLFRNERVHNTLKKIATGTSVYGISKGNLSKIKIPLPPLPEQRAIANILSTWDTAIQTTQALIRQKEQEKKWLMQELLTGKKRLNGFEGTSEIHRTDLGLKLTKGWPIIKVKDIFQERKETSNNQTDYPLYSLTIEAGLTEKTERYERSFLLKDQTNNMYKLVYPNDILFNPMNLRFGAIAKSKIDDVVSVSAYYNSIHFRDNNVNVDFYEALFKTHEFFNLYERIAIGSLMEKKRVHLSNFLELEIPFPNFEEQTAIATVLQTADKEIELLKAKLEQQKLQKKGLMQVLLTGEVRVKI